MLYVKTLQLKVSLSGEVPSLTLELNQVKSQLANPYKKQKTNNEWQVNNAIHKFPSKTNYNRGLACLILL